jgi:hypothetical protein
MRLSEIEIMSSRHYDVSPDEFECVGECIDRAVESDPSASEETVECDCEELLAEQRLEWEAVRAAGAKGVDY